MNNKIVAIHHITIQTTDIDRALQFYVDVLGVALIKRQKFKRRHMAWLQAGNLRIELMSKREGETLKEWDDYCAGPVKLCFMVHSLDKFLEYVLEQGISLHPSHPEPFTPPVADAKKIAYILGPDGEEIEIRNVGHDS